MLRSDQDLRRETKFLPVPNVGCSIGAWIFFRGGHRDRCAMRGGLYSSWQLENPTGCVCHSNSGYGSVLSAYGSDGPPGVGVAGAAQAARSRTFATVQGCHRPPRAVRTPRAFSASAIFVSVLHPAFSIS